MESFVLNLRKTSDRAEDILTFWVYRPTTGNVLGTEIRYECIEEFGKFRYSDERKLGSLTSNLITTEGEWDVYYDLGGIYVGGTLSDLAKTVIRTEQDYGKQYESFANAMLSKYRPIKMK